jgi:acyl-coenzyme A thioesterase PaaI-like protein
MEVILLDYEAVRAGLEAAIPYNRYLGLSVSEVGDGRGVVVLPQEDHLHNHVGSQHAGALFSAGEAASGAAFVGAFAEHMGNVTLPRAQRGHLLPEAGERTRSYAVRSSQT